MTAHVDILLQRERVRGAFARSLLLHAGLTAAVIASAWLGPGPRETFGDPSSQGGGTPVTPVTSIPMFRQNEQFSPVARDTQSQVPDKRREQTREPDEPDAISLTKKDPKKKEEKKIDLARYLEARKRSQEQFEENQMFSRSGAAVGSPLIGSPGSGGVGLSTGNPFGARFGAYAQLIRECVARKWTTAGVDPRLRTAPVAVIGFEILRNGTARSIRVLQSSGNQALDYSGMRAVTDCSPFKPLPAEFERNSASIEFHFQLQR